VKNQPKCRKVILKAPENRWFRLKLTALGRNRGGANNSARLVSESVVSFPSNAEQVGIIAETDKRR
jgi:hypothetical protein